MVKIRRFGLGNILNWEMLAELVKVWVCLEKKKNPGYFVRKKKKKNARKLLRKFYYKCMVL